MDFVIGIVGVLVGLFMWSAILGSIFVTLPAEKRRVKEGKQANVHWPRLLGTVIFWLIILFIAGFFSTPFFIGTASAFVIMLFNIGNLKKEEKQTRG